MSKGIEGVGINAHCVDISTPWAYPRLSEQTQVPEDGIPGISTHPRRDMGLIIITPCEGIWDQTILRTPSLWTDRHE